MNETKQNNIQLNKKQNHEKLNQPLIYHFMFTKE